MGQGIWLPTKYRRKPHFYELCFADIYDDEAAQDPIISEMRFQDFEEIVLSLLPDGFFPDGKTSHHYDQPMHVTASRKYLDVVLEDELNRCAVCVLIRPDFEEHFAGDDFDRETVEDEARFDMKLVALELEQGLYNRGYDLFYRHNAYQMKPYVPKGCEKRA